jgi:cytoskeletal protein CcmA (bactofilin family)
MASNCRWGDLLRKGKREMKLNEQCEMLTNDGYGYVLCGDLIAEEDIEIDIYPCLIVKGNVRTSKSIHATGGLIAEGDITAGREIIVCRELEALGSIEAGWDIKAEWEIKAGGHIKTRCDIYAEDSILAEGEIEACEIETYGDIECSQIKASSIVALYGSVTIKKEKT